MRSIKELETIPRLQILVRGQDGVKAFANPAASKGANLHVIASWGGGWDHVSVSLPNRCPTWDEMAAVKNMFFRPNETAIEYHPAELNYVNQHPYCLHIWKPQNEEIPQPPMIFV